MRGGRWRETKEEEKEKEKRMMGGRGRLEGGGGERRGAWRKTKKGSTCQQSRDRHPYCQRDSEAPTLLLKKKGVNLIDDKENNKEKGKRRTITKEGEKKVKYQRQPC